MPRTAKPNRTDLLVSKPEPVSTVPGQGYGVAGAQQAAQQAVPMGPPPVALGGGAAGPPSPAAPPPSAPGPLPGAAGAFTRPTERPNEPIHAGMPTGPGPGPESLGGVGALAGSGEMEGQTLKGLLANLAAQPGASSAVMDLAQRALAGNR